MRQQWTIYGDATHTKQGNRVTTDVNAVEHFAIAHDRVTGFYRNSIDVPLNAYERGLYADAFCTVLKAKVDKAAERKEFRPVWDHQHDCWIDAHGDEVKL